MEKPKENSTIILIPNNTESIEKMVNMIDIVDLFTNYTTLLVLIMLTKEKDIFTSKTIMTAVIAVILPMGVES